MKPDAFKLYACLDGKIVELEAVAICFQSHEAAQGFADFAQRCSDRMAALADDFSHDHFNGGGLPDVTIERLMDEA